MPRRERPVKIKRYKNRNNRNMVLERRLKQYGAILALLLVVVGAGYFLGRPLVRMLANRPKTEKPQSSQAVENSTDNTAVDSEAMDTEKEETDVTQEGTILPIPAKNRVYYKSDAVALTTEQGMDTQIAAAKRAGATCFVIDLKDDKGNVLYPSQNKYASRAKSSVQIDLSVLVRKLSENGLTPVARLYTFMDQVITGLERSTAVMYQGTDTRWLDTSAALGGKPWANPASSIVQQYILDLVDELMAMGIKEFVFAGYHTPTGYSLDKRDFGVPMDTVLANMKSLISTLKGKISAKGGYCSWQIDYSRISPDGSYRQYIVHPYQLGVDNFIITANSDIDQTRVVPRLMGSTGEDVKTITLWITGSADTSLTHQLGSYFVN